MPKSFHIPGFTITFNDEQLLYNNLRNQFYDLYFFYPSKNNGEDFFSIIEKYSSLDAFINVGFDEGLKRIMLATKLTCELFVKTTKNYTVDADSVFRNNYSYIVDPWLKAFSEIKNQLNSINTAAEIKDEYRSARKEYRSKWVGGGYGIGGALKGAAKAGAMNMVSGAMHDVRNSFEKGLDSSTVSTQKNSIFNSSETKENLRSGLVRSVNRVFNACLDMFNIKNAFSNNYEKARSLFNNLDNMSEEDKQTNLAKIILYDPYEEEYYKKYLSYYGDEKKELEAMGDFFGLDIKSVKIEIINEYQNKRKKETTEDLVKLCENIEKIADFINTDASSYINNLKTQIEVKDREERTVKGFVFETHEEADKAKIEEKLIEEIKSRYNHEFSEKECIACINEIEKQNFETQVSEIIKKELRNHAWKLHQEVIDFEKNFVHADVKGKLTFLLERFWPFGIWLIHRLLFYEDGGLIYFALSIFVALATLSGLIDLSNLKKGYDEKQNK